MDTKHRVLEILEKNRGKSVSGEYIAGLLNLSRNMIWKAIKSLRDDGYVIEAVTNKGYRLTNENDILAAEGIKPFLASAHMADNIKVHRELDSTNREAKALAIAGAPHGSVIIAERQVSGRGRRDRDFFSPPGRGLYMSMILNSDMLGFHHPTAITAFAAVCVCEAIEGICDLKPAIKWVNDIFLNGRKICGILTEVISDFETRHIREIIIGIGVNINTLDEDFPDSLQGLAGSLYPDGKANITRNQLAAEIINRVFSAEKPGEAQIFERYRSRLFMLNTEVAIIKDGEKCAVKALDIDDSGHLLVKTQEGEILTLVSDEVKII